MDKGLVTGRWPDCLSEVYLIDYHLPYGQVIAETDGSGNVTASYVYGQDRISMTRGGSTHWYVADGQGSVRQLTDASGNVTDRWTYTAFGEIIGRTGATQNAFTYTGEQWDPNAHFYYLRARYMDPSTGRFTSVDPFEGKIKQPITLHRYLYANCSPTFFTDHTGKFGLAEVTAIMAISASLVSAQITYPVGDPTIPQKREGFDQLWSNYLGFGMVVDGMTAEEVYEYLGGRVKYNHEQFPESFVNSCALRMSRALNYAGHVIPYSPGKTISASDNMWYFFRVKDVVEYIKGVYCPADRSGVSESQVFGKRGIVLFGGCGWSDASGHVDLWNKLIAGDHAYWGQCTDTYFWGFK